MDLPVAVRLGIGLGLAATLAYVATPVAIHAARRLDFYDHPTGYKGHAAPTPYLGGAAVIAAFALALIVGAGHPGSTFPLLGGVGAMLLLGTIDDRRTVTPQLRVAVEFILGALLAAAGLGWHLGAGGGLDAIATGVWVIAVVNAFNLFDNMDGAAASMALVVAGGACVLALLTGDTWVAVGSAALCGACIGFLPHNLASPARIFLGDGGSMPIGFAVAALVANAARSAEPSQRGLLLGFLLVGVPAVDTCLVIISRRRRGAPILSGGQDHLTHRARPRVRSARRVAFVLAGTQLVVSSLVIVASRASSSGLVYILLAFLVCAVTALVALEQEATAGAELPAPAAPGAAQPAAPANEWTTPVLVALLGLGAGVSPLFSAYYGQGVWIPLGLLAVVAAGAVAIAFPPRVTLPGGLAFLGLVGLGLWSLISTGWAHSVEQATVEANQWLAYAAFLLLMIVLLRGRRHASLLLVGVGAGIAIVAASVLVRMLASDPGSLFLAGRLNSPLGYINGEGCVFAMGCCFGLALAERREPVLAGLGAAATVAMACLTLLSQSRGAAIAISVAIVVTLVAVPGFRRRVIALAIVGGAVALAGHSVLRVYSVGVSGTLPASVAHSAAGTILGCSALAGMTWGLTAAIERAADRGGGQRSLVLRRFATGLVVFILAVPSAVALANIGTIGRTARTQWHAFVHLSDSGSRSATTTQTRLLSGGGNRYDYWRIAWNTFDAHPLVGVGAGNYAESYYRQRRTQESIQNPHSLELQTLSELGLVGALLIGLFIIGVTTGARRSRALASSSCIARSTMVAASGVVVVWLVDTSGDWMHLLPGVVAIAFAGVAVLCWGGGDGAVDRGRPSGRGAGRILLAAAGVGFVLVVSGASLLRAGLTQHYVGRARGELAAHPTSTIDDAGRALHLDSANLDAYYLKAAAFARLHRAAAARATLLDAARQDTQDFVTWTLLGDLEVRTGDLASAKTFYGRALALDPRDPTLRAVTANPASAR